jgi:L-malate glycosyltransferase
MKILMLNYEFPPMGGGGGRATFNIARELVRFGHDVHVLTSKVRGQMACEVYEGITIHRLPTWRKSIHDCGFIGAFVYVFFAYFKLLELVRRHEFDILHYFFSLPTGLLSILPGKHRDIPYIVSLRGSDVPHYDPYNQQLETAHRFMKPLTVRIWEQAKEVVALSDSLGRTALRTNQHQCMKIIRNGIDTDVFRPPITRGNRKTLKLVVVSRLIERKGIQYILAAIAKLKDKDIELTIVGRGNYESNLKRICRVHELERKITFHGYCTNEMLPRIYQEHDVFILTSLAESFGIVFLEAMACGLPAIAGRTGGIPDIISEENGILVEPTDIDEIRDAILKMQENPELRRQMGYKNRHKVLDSYSWRNVAMMYQDIYHSTSPVTGMAHLPLENILN